MGTGLPVRNTGDSKYNAETALDAILDDLQVRWHAPCSFSALPARQYFLMLIAPVRHYETVLSGHTLQTFTDTRMRFTPKGCMT